MAAAARPETLADRHSAATALWKSLLPPDPDPARLMPSTKDRVRIPWIEARSDRFLTEEGSPLIAKKCAGCNIDRFPFDALYELSISAISGGHSNTCFYNAIVGSIFGTTNNGKQLKDLTLKFWKYLVKRGFVHQQLIMELSASGSELANIVDPQVLMNTQLQVINNSDHREGGLFIAPIIAFLLNINILIYSDKMVSSSSFGPFTFITPDSLLADCGLRLYKWDGDCAFAFDPEKRDYDVETIKNAMTQTFTITGYEHPRQGDNFEYIPHIPFAEPARITVMLRHTGNHFDAWIPKDDRYGVQFNINYNLTSYFFCGHPGLSSDSMRVYREQFHHYIFRTSESAARGQTKQIQLGSKPSALPKPPPPPSSKAAGGGGLTDFASLSLDDTPKTDSLSRTPADDGETKFVLLVSLLSHQFHLDYDNIRMLIERSVNKVNDILLEYLKETTTKLNNLTSEVQTFLRPYVNQKKSSSYKNMIQILCNMFELAFEMYTCGLASVGIDTYLTPSEQRISTEIMHPFSYLEVKPAFVDTLDLYPTLYYLFLKSSGSTTKRHGIKAVNYNVSSFRTAASDVIERNLAILPPTVDIDIATIIITVRDAGHTLSYISADEKTKTVYIDNPDLDFEGGRWVCTTKEYKIQGTVYLSYFQEGIDDKISFLEGACILIPKLSK